MKELTPERSRELILPRREARAPWDTASATERATLARGAFVRGGTFVAESERRAGLEWNVGFPVRIAMAAGERALCKKGGLMPCWAACLDGYDLVRALDPGAQPSQPFKSEGARTAWLKKTLRVDHQADDGLKAIAAALSDDWLADTPGRDRTHEVATASAFFAGILLGLYACPDHRAASHFTSILAAAKPRRAEAAPPAVASVELDEELLAAVLAEPEDDGPRLVLADWLTDRGDPRGEFIQIQCTLKRSLVGTAGRATPLRYLDASAEELADREKALLARHGAEWAEREAPGLTKRVWHRGFVEGGMVRAANVSALASITRTPLRSIKIEGLQSRDIGDLVSTSVPKTLTTVDLSYNRIGETRGRVFEAPMIAQARTLALGGNAGFGSPKLMAAMLAGARSVTCLHLQGTSLTDASFAMLARSERFAALEMLTLRSNPGLSPHWIRQLARATSLRWLALGSGSSADHARNLELLRALVELAPPTLTHVNIRASSLPPDLLLALQRRFELGGLGFELSDV